MLDRQLIEAMQDTDKWLVLFCSFIELTDSCWLWTGTGGHQDTATFGYKEKTTSAVKIAYNLANDNNPYASVGKGNVIMHSCDNVMCVNPDHLSIGTHQDNAIEKGRQLKIRYPIKLNYELAEKIRAEYKEGNVTQLFLSQKYDVTLRNMQALIARDIWKSPKAYKVRVFPLTHNKLF